MEGGSIGIGKGGPYGGWGWGWHTIIYNDGGIYTDRLHASSGDFTGYVHATSGYFENVTIAENCNVLGTVYANKLVGDVVATRHLQSGNPATILSANRDRVVTFIGVVTPALRSGKDAYLYIDGVLVAKYHADRADTPAGPTPYVFSYQISANAQHTVAVASTSGEGATVIVSPVSSATFA